MLDRKDRRALLWSGVALVGAACLGHQAFAGNVVETNPPGTFYYFSANLQVGAQYLQNLSGYQILVDDVTYAPTFGPGSDLGSNLFPSPAIWMNTTLSPWTAYELAGSGPTGPHMFGNGVLGDLNAIFFDTTVWSDCAGFDYATQLTDVMPGTPSTVVKAFDESSTVFHATLLGRHTVVNDTAAASECVATGLGISESLATVSESRHYQTPVLIAPGNEIHAAFRFGPPVAPPGPPLLFTVYIKGRVNTGLPLFDASNLIYQHTGP